MIWKIILNNIYIHNCYLAGNTLRLHYKNKLVKAVGVNLVYYKNRMKYTDILRMENGENFDVEAGGLYSNHCYLKGEVTSKVLSLLVSEWRRVLQNDP